MEKCHFLSVLSNILSMQLTTHQKQAFDSLKAFVPNQGVKAFVLKGYAGTGKTTLIGHLVKWLKEKHYTPVLLATTGRAAKVLENKTGTQASTVHSCIYVFDEVAGNDESGKDAWESDTGQLFLNFDLRQGNVSVENAVYIVDEASMISHEVSSQEHTARFGSGSLLDDFFRFSENRKVVFVGDPCQLPPIADNPFSGALDDHFLQRRYGIQAVSVELREILRQDAGSEILRIAGQFRDGIVNGTFQKYPKVKLPAGANAHLYNDDKALVAGYVEKLRSGGWDKAIMICNANWQCSRLNTNIRQMLGYRDNLHAGELLMVVQNSYNVDLANGDQVLVEKATYDCNRAGLEFLNVTVRALHNQAQYHTKLIQNLLHSEEPGLGVEQVKKLLIDFDQRMRNRGIRRNSAEYRQFMLHDPYLNALRAKFGYAITCHKSQGGEWKHVYLNIYKSVYGMQGPNLYRWYYTALTRAQQHLHLNDGWWVEGFDFRK